jgi:hypothetical protein
MVTCALQAAAMRTPHASLHNTIDRKSYKPGLAVPDVANCWRMSRNHLMPVVSSQTDFPGMWAIGAEKLISHEVFAFHPKPKLTLSIYSTSFTATAH